jgi:RNA polymerase sigma-B factor
MAGTGRTWEDNEERFRVFVATRDPRVRNELLEANLPLVRPLAMRFAHRGEPLDDLIQVGSIGLVKAVDRFDPDRGVKFATFATRTILGELKRHFRDRAWSVRAPRRLQELCLELGRASELLAQRLGREATPAELAAEVGVSEHNVLEALQAGRAFSSVSLDAPVTARGADLGSQLGVADERFEEAEWQAVLRPHLQALPWRDRAVLALRFEQELTQAEIAARVGVSQVQVSRQLAGNLDRLRQLCAEAM